VRKLIPLAARGLQGGMEALLTVRARAGPYACLLRCEARRGQQLPHESRPPSRGGSGQQPTLGGLVLGRTRQGGPAGGAQASRPAARRAPTCGSLGTLPPT
jgi:hypothetical protein